MKRQILTGLLVLLCTAITFAQTSERTVSGIVKDKKSNKALVNVNIAIEGTNIGTVTNDDGVFTLKWPESGKGIVASHVSYQNTFIPVQQFKEQDGQIIIWTERSITSFLI